MDVQVKKSAFLCAFSKLPTLNYRFADWEENTEHTEDIWPYHLWKSTGQLGAEQTVSLRFAWVVLVTLSSGAPCHW